MLGPGTVNIGTLSGGVAANVIAAEAQAEILVRVVGRAADAEATLQGIVGGDSSLDYRVFSKKDAVTCETLPGFDVAPVSFGTDIPYLTELGKPLLLGPGSILDAHGAEEKIGKREAVRAVELYHQAVSHLLERAS